MDFVFLIDFVIILESNARPQDVQAAFWKQAPEERPAWGP